MNRKVLFSFLFLGSWCQPFVSGQGDVQANAQDGPPVIRANVDVVNVLCTVQDRRGKYLVDLKKEDFEVFENGARQRIDFFNNDTGADAQPLTIVLLIDTSGSVKDKLAFEQEAASEFLRQSLRPEKDMAAIIQFDSEVALVQDFTYDLGFLEDAIYGIRAGGSTRMYDAIYLAVEELFRHEVGRKLMVILSDGADTQSSTSEEEAIRVAQDADVVIYGVGVKGRLLDSDFRILERFAKATGGLFFNPKARLKELRDAFAKINQGIKSQYGLGYVSTRPSQDGSFRELEVRAKGKKLKVTHRRGYYAAGGPP